MLIYIPLHLQGHLLDDKTVVSGFPSSTLITLPHFLIAATLLPALEDYAVHALVLVLLIFRGMHVGKVGAKCKDFKEYVHKCLNKLGLEDRISEVCMSVWCPTCVPLCKYVGSVTSPPFVFFLFVGFI